MDLKSIAHDLTNLCAKEYTRRFSDNNQLKDLVEKADNMDKSERDNSPMIKKVVDTASNFLKSPGGNQGSSSQNQKTVSNF